MRKLKVLHTADWHLGRNLKDIQRESEFIDVLNQLYQYLEREQPDLILLAGDIFDSSLPSIWAQRLYYDFCSRVSRLAFTPAVVITGGNHDSALLLDAPQALLSSFNIHVIGGSYLDINKEVIPIYSQERECIAIVLAVPYLRDSQLKRARRASEVESWSEQLHDAMRLHYQEVIAQGLALRGDADIPLIAMGHLFMQGGVINEHDGMRPPVGTLGAFVADTTFDAIDYLALGHLHQPQMVGGREHWRYAGSLLKSAFSETGHEKSLTLISFQGKKIETIELLPLQSPIPLIRLTGTFEEQELAIDRLEKEGTKVYVEMQVSERFLTPASTLQSHLKEKSSPVMVLQLTRLQKMGTFDMMNNLPQKGISLAQITPIELFKERLLVAQLEDSDLEHKLEKLFLQLEKELLEQERE